MSTQIKNYVKWFAAFIAGALFSFVMFVFFQNIVHLKQEKALKVVNTTFDLKLQGDTSYEQYCEYTAPKIERLWPTEARSFWVMIVDRWFGSYQGVIFLDTGDIFSFETKHGFITSFTESKWPDRRKGEKGWLQPAY